MHFFIKLAEQIIEVKSMYDKVCSMCQRYIISDSTHIEPDIVIETSRSDLEKFRENTNIENDARQNDISHNEYLETLSVYTKIANAMIEYDTLLIHGSVVSTGGNGYMITAPSGVGKTTRTDLWVKNIPETIVINGDKPLIKISDEEVIVYGTPWCGKEGWNNNIGVPLRSVLFLERADNGEKDEVTEIDAGSGVIKLFSQTYQPPGNKMNRIFHLLHRMNGKVKFYNFRSSPTSEAVKLAYGTINSEQQSDT